MSKVNKHILRTVSQILLTTADIPMGALVTVSHVETTPNMRFSRVWLYVNPGERAQEVLDSLKKQMYDIQGELNRAMESHSVPRISFMHDAGLDYADTINKKLHEIEHDPEE